MMRGPYLIVVLDVWIGTRAALHRRGFAARLRRPEGHMGRMRTFETVRNERGVALPTALITLVLLTTLMLAFAVLSQTEPVIAANQLRVSQARAQAESGFEYAVWALSAGNVAAPPAGTIANPMPSSPAPAPFNGVTFTSIGDTGGFLVTVINDPAGDPDVRRITSTGWT